MRGYLVFCVGSLYLKRGIFDNVILTPENHKANYPHLLRIG